MRELHIGLITPYYAGATSAGSGIGVHFRNLAEGLLAAGHRITAILPVATHFTTPSSLPANIVLATADVPLFAAPAGRLSWQLHQWLCERALLRAASRVARAATDVDVWETTSTGSTALRFLRDSRRSPIITRVSTTASQLRATNRGSSNWISRVHERWERRAVLGGEAVVTHSAGHRDWIAQEFGLDPAHIPVIPHGVSIPDLSEQPVGRPARILYVGRLETRKGADLLLAALPSALSAHPGSTATLVGLDASGSWERQWRQTAPPEIVNRVIFAGIVDDAKLASHYREADVFVAPSRYESFGLMFAEAMAWGLPVVALRAPGALELVSDGETGLLTPPEDVPALAEALQRLIGDISLRQRLGRSARLRVIARYSRDEMVRSSTALYHSLISVRKR